MKNLYKIEDELYIISDTENVNENCWIITDGRLVQVSYLLSDEVAKGNKVILTTNKLLIANGVQAIDDIFLEWFVKNPTCEIVEVQKWFDGLDFLEYKIIIPQEEPCSFCKGTGQTVSSTTISGFTTCDCINFPQEEPKQDPLEEAAKEYSKRHLDVSGNLGKYLVKAVFQDGANYQAERMYSEEEVKRLAFDFYYDMSRQMGVAENLISENATNVDVWFEQFKKK